MNNKKIQSGIEDIKKIKMTNEEKSKVFNNIINQNPVPSIWSNYFFFIKESRFARFAVVAFFIIFTSGGIVSASEESLPSSFLYPLKVQVVEPIKSAMKKTPEEKAQYQSDLATERLIEAETLASKGKLSKPNEKKIASLLNDHTKAFNQALTEMNQVESADYVQEAVTNFHAEMGAHAEVLDVITNGSEDKENEVSKVARQNGEKIKSNLKESHDSKSDKYRKKKEDIKLIIDSTSTELNDVIEDKEVEEKIIHKTNKTLEKAKEYLNKAEQIENEEENSNSNDAYSALLESESSAKEAGIFLKTGIKFQSKSQDNR